MKNNYNEEIKKVKLKEEDFYRIREAVEKNLAEKDRHKKQKFRPFAVAAAIVFIIAGVFCVPQVRTFAQSVGQTIREKIIFSFSDGTKGELSIGEDFTQISIKKADDEESFFNEKNGRIYFSLNGDDITDTVEKQKYFRFEINRENGKSVLIIGGESGKYGWCELVFDKSGKYITNRMNIPIGADEGTPAWLNEAMHNEGVPCGVPELDSQLENPPLNKR